MRWAGYQRRYLRDRSRLKLVLKARRIGFSEVACFERACRAVGIEMWPGMPIREVKPVPQNLVSAGMEQAKKLLKRVMFHIEGLEKVAQKKLIVKQSATMAELTNGIALSAFSCNPRSVRGDGGDLMLDEWAAQRWQEEMWAAASPLANPTLGNPNGFDIVVIFTPLGDSNLAYEMSEGTDWEGTFSKHRVTIVDAAADGFPIKVKRKGKFVTGTIEDLRREYVDEDMFNQEFMCSFMSSSDRYISEAIYKGAMYDDDDLPSDFDGIGRTYDFAGIDVARKRDQTAVSRLSRYGDVNYHRFTEKRRDMPWDQQEEWVDGLINGCQRVMVDSTGIGNQFAERMGSRWPGRIEPVDFTNTNKEVLATGLKLALQMKKLRVREDDEDLMREVLAMRREVTEFGNIRYLSPRTGSGHGDGAWSLALAENASGGAAVPQNLIPRVSTPDASRSPVGRVRPGGWQ